MATAAAHQTASTIGVENVVIAPVTSDDDKGIVYGALQKLAGAIEITITPSNTDANVQYADDIEFDTVNPDPDITFKTEMADIPLAVQQLIYGQTIDDNGVLLRNATDKPAYFAVGFRSLKTDNTYRYVWMYKVRAKALTETYHTKEGTTLTRQTGSVEWKGIKRTFDGRYQAVADVGQNGFTEEMAKTFLDSVYTPVITNKSGS